MDGLFTLLSLSMVMAIASFSAGLLPLSFSLTPSQLRLISTIGMGVLVGTSLIVIIPEGVDTLYSASKIGNVHTRRASSSWFIAKGSQDIRALYEREASDTAATSMLYPVLPGPSEKPPSKPVEPGPLSILQKDEDKNTAGDSSEGATASKEHNDSPHAWIGVALIAGFILMFVIDKLPQYTSSSKPAPRPYHISLNDLGRGLQRTPSQEHDTGVDGFLQGGSTPQEHSRSFATTTGLIIHAAADGIALGASSSSADAGLSFIIFFAIMVHKAPAAFGLTSILLKQGLSKRTARTHLLFFSLAAPTGAILTWLFARTVGAGRIGNARNTTWWTGMLLLFSAGTFLYVAMHTMQEIESSHDIQQNGHVNGMVENTDTQSQSPKASLQDFMAAIFGMVLPLFLQVGHAH
ncbi:hypothetical protein EPUS_07817 [Endocarpon pusillum Z07020]|uniref:Zinc transporter ZIP9 n=1 Tax=Endocarpon pusillum (strain Z07020 / HMAS-L-300199) TaxID=1263415 RepID=U1GRZ2_ENDPU|nr:uncharacterized protein EPUS_07817 [Endocarpon pusillum Z07020]ERF75128.1 hypothetical protein EPUS_07817 [Endocarpon pusillum Z07020]